MFLWGYSKDKYLIENTIISNNVLERGGPNNESKGGGLDVRDRASLVIRNSSVVGNVARQQGGGLWVDCRGPEGIVIENTTFSGNQAAAPDNSGDIGGAAVFNSSASTRVSVTNATFVGNAANRADGCIWIAGSANAQNLTFTNCLFAGNRAGATSQREQTVNFPALSGGGNFVQNSSNAVQNIPGATYLADLRLSPSLQLVAGAGLTMPVHPLLANSPLIDGGVAVSGLGADQLGASRPQDGNRDGTAQFDPGAVEFSAPAPPPIVTALASAAPPSTSLSSFPNPFTQQTTITYTLLQPGRTVLTLHDATGRRVALLLDQLQSVGAHTLTFSADVLGLTDGVYYCGLQTANGNQSQRLVLVK